MGTRSQWIAMCLVVVAVVPYTALKLAWLAGSTVGLRTDAQVAELHSSRMVAGNIVTIVLELLAVALAIALVRPWGRRVPAWAVLGLAGGATGLLAPILLGLTMGSALQLVVAGDLHTRGMDNMSPWVFAIAYGGFGLLALGIAVLAWRYSLDRWGWVLSRPPRRPAAWATIAGALGLLPFGVTMVSWGVLGPGEAGPHGMDAVAQRTVLVLSGLFAIIGWLTPLLARPTVRRSRTAWLVTWTGCTTAALQSLTQVLLANQGDPTPAMILLALASFPGASIYGLSVLRRRLVDNEFAEPAQGAELARA